MKKYKKELKQTYKVSLYSNDFKTASNCAFLLGSKKKLEKVRILSLENGCLSDSLVCIQLMNELDLKQETKKVKQIEKFN